MAASKLTIPLDCESRKQWQAGQNFMTDCQLFKPIPLSPRPIDNPKIGGFLMSERWCKLYPHALTDPLWLAVADDAGTSPGLVGATFVELLTWTTEHAPDSGSIAGFDPRVWAAWMRVKVDEIERIIASLRNFGRLAGDTIANWLKRQGQAAIAAARSVSTPRTRKFRAKERDRRQGELLLPIEGTRERVPGVPDDVSEASGNTQKPPNIDAQSRACIGNADIERERDSEVFKYPQTPTRWGLSQTRKPEGRDESAPASGGGGNCRRARGGKEGRGRPRRGDRALGPAARGRRRR